MRQRATEQDGRSGGSGASASRGHGQRAESRGDGGARTGAAAPARRQPVLALPRRRAGRLPARVEIYLRQLDTVDPATEGAWLRVVVKHEAMAIRRAPAGLRRSRGRRPGRNVHGGLREVDDEVAGGERVDRSVEALKALKPDEARALLLKAEGLSYEEIGQPLRLDLHEGQPLASPRAASAVPEGLQRDRGGRGVRALRGAALAPLAGGDRDERAGRLDPPAPAPLRDVPRGRARHALLAHAPARAAAPFGWLSAPALALGRGRRLYALQRRRPVRAGGGGARGLCLSGAGAGAACVMSGALPAPTADRAPPEQAGGEGAGVKKVVATAQPPPARPEPPTRPRRVRDAHARPSGPEAARA